MSHSFEQFTIVKFRVWKPVRLSFSSRHSIVWQKSPSKYFIIDWPGFNTDTSWNTHTSSFSKKRKTVNKKYNIEFLINHLKNFYLNLCFHCDVQFFQNQNRLSPLHVVNNPRVYLIMWHIYSLTYNKKLICKLNCYSLIELPPEAIFYSRFQNFRPTRLSNYLLFPLPET